MNITIEQLQEKDFSAYQLLEKKMLMLEHEWRPWKKAMEEEKAESWKTRNWYEFKARELNGYLVFVAKDDNGNIYGVVSCSIPNDTLSFPEQAYHKHIAYIRELFVEKEYRGKQIGTRLLQKVVDHLKQNHLIEKISMHVFTHEVEAALKVAEKSGLFHVGKLSKQVKVKDKYYDEHFLELLIDRN